MKWTAVLGAAVVAAARVGFAQNDPAPLAVDITVDAGGGGVPLNPIWRFCGYDEPNYTYGALGKKVVKELAEASAPLAPAFFRTHNLLTTGDGTPRLKWGSTNAYTEDPAGKPVYSWTILDKIFDTYHDLGAKPYVEIGFSPEALSSHPEPYAHNWTLGRGGNLYTGWSYAPRDYDKWRDLIYQWAKHSAERYGTKEVESWNWEVWNEPNIGYLHGSNVEDYEKIYDYAADGLKKAVPGAKIGGAETAGPGGEFQRSFIEHCLNGTNFATGKKGSPLDSISFHAKGAPINRNGHVRMGIQNQLRDLQNGFAIAAEREETRKLPIVIGESDPDSCAACASAEGLYPQYGYRNGTLFAAYTIEQLTRTLDLAQRQGVNVLGSTTWAFTFEDQPIFGGFRQISTDGIELPVLNVFRMLGKLGKTRLAVKSTGDVGLDTIVQQGVRGEQPDVYAIAARDEKRVTVIAWNYHDDDVPGQTAEVSLRINGLPADAKNAHLAEWRIDETHSNAYTAWKKMGSPAKPTDEQHRELETSAQLGQVRSGAAVAVDGGAAEVKLELPRQAVSLVEISW